MKTYVCGIFTSNQRVLVGTYKVFTDKEMIKEWIRTMNWHPEQFKGKTDAEALTLLSAPGCAWGHNLSIHEVTNTDDLAAYSRKVNPREFFE